MKYSLSNLSELYICIYDMHIIYQSIDDHVFIALRAVIYQNATVLSNLQKRFDIHRGGGGGGGGGGCYVWFVSMQQPKGSVTLMAQIQIPPFIMHTSSLCKVSCLFSTGKSAPGSPLFLSLFIYERGMQLFLYDKLPFELLPREKLL